MIALKIKNCAEEALNRLAPALARAAAETAAAFFSTEASLISDASSAPPPSNFGSVYCSQKNIGEKFEMICNLAVEKSGWDGLFSAGESDEIRLDALCELANCVCGSVLSDPGFSDEFGYLIPCVPCAGSSQAPGNSRSLRGSFQLRGSWIHFSFTILEKATQRAVPMSKLKSKAA